MKINYVFLGCAKTSLILGPHSTFDTQAKEECTIRSPYLEVNNTTQNQFSGSMIEAIGPLRMPSK